jgi:acyl-coenzyme A synthetase/AMP-(fatty) acid ligase
LGEIESVLQSHPQVQQVIVRTESETHRLIAYIISEQGFEISDLRLFLEDRLHDYMIPTAFIRLERFPLTPSDKIDLRALPKPDQTRPLLETGYIAPQSELEHSLAMIWQNALGLKQIGIEDNLFI